jgi:osmoprotectant transport system ATP-binding protein
VDEFVADFVGHDRALKALSLKTLGDLDLAPASGADGLPRLAADTSQRDALALLVDERRDAILVTDAAGSPLGVATREQMIG